MSPTRRLPIDLSELDQAFENASDEVRSYLDLATGQVIAMTPDIQYELEAIYGIAYDDGGNEVVAFDEALDRHSPPDWMRDLLQEAHLVEQDDGTRFIDIPTADSREAYRDMERFIDTVSDARLHDELSRAIQGRGAFRRFKDTLLAFPKQREDWFVFSAAQVRERVLEWLEDEGIVVVSSSIG